MTLAVRGANAHWYLRLYMRLKIQRWRHTDITLNSASWYKVYLARPGWHFLINRAHTLRHRVGSASDSHSYATAYLCWQILQIPSEQVCNLWSLWAAKDIYSPINIILSWYVSCHPTLFIKNFYRYEQQQKSSCRKRHQAGWLVCAMNQHLSAAQGDISNERKKCDFEDI